MDKSIIEEAIKNYDKMLEKIGSFEGHVIALQAELIKNPDETKRRTEEHKVMIYNSYESAKELSRLLSGFLLSAHMVLNIKDEKDS